MKDKEDESYIRQKDNIKSKTSLLLSGCFACVFHMMYTRGVIHIRVCAYEYPRKRKPLKNYSVDVAQGRGNVI